MDKAGLCRKVFLVISRFDVIKDLVTNLCPSRSVGVEIGVHRGKTSQTLLRCKNVNKLYSVDPYKYFDNGEWPDALNKHQGEMNKIYKKTRKRLKEFGDRSVLLRMTSFEAAFVVKEDLDFVFVDGNHTYDYVKNDIINWFPKIKGRGIMFGHDWVDKGKHVDFFSSVKRAVRDVLSSKKDDIEVGTSRRYGLKLDYKIDPKKIVNQTLPEHIEDGIWWVIKR